jgi:DNA-binding LacI/PurR family transcriptional regulator
MPLPFTVNKEALGPLHHQIVYAVQEAIRSGQFKPGDRLPAMLAMADELGVSETVIRTAIRQLTLDGLLSARRRTGIQVCRLVPGLWRSVVLTLVPHVATSWYFATRFEAMQANLQADKVRCLQLSYSGGPDSNNWREIEHVLDAQAIDAAVVVSGPGGIEGLLRERGIPILQFSPQEELPDALGVCIEQEEQAFSDLIHHLQAISTHQVGVFSFHSDGPCVVLCERLQAAGLAASRLELTFPEEVWSQGQEVVGFHAMRRLLATGKALPPCLIFNDDHHARGALVALHEARVDVPGTVQLVTTVNRGHIPPFPGGFTRIERDPMALGQALAELTRHGLKLPRRRRRFVAPPAVFIAGASTRNPLGS